MTSIPKKKEKIDLWAVIYPEFDLTEISDTIGGALRHFKSLFEKIQTPPQVNQIFFHVENQLKEEDQKAFENRQKAVKWFQCKLEQLSVFLPAGGDLSHHIKSLLKFETVILGSRGYLGALLSNLRQVASEVVKDKESHSLFKGWAQIDRLSSGEFCILEFVFPDYVEQEMNKPSREEEIYQWKEKADTSLATLFRFLKILTLYDFFVPLTLGAESSSTHTPKNYQEFEQRQYQAHVGSFLNLFKSSDSSKHPLSIEELIKLVERFVFMLEKEMKLVLIDAKEGDILLNQEHWRTQRCDDDIEALIPFAKKCWKQALPKCKYPMRLSREEMVDDLLNNLPKTISLHAKDKKRLPRAIKALKRTDPRIFENGRYLTLQPHWELFEWVD